MEFTSRAIGLMISGFSCLLLAAFLLWQYPKRRIARALASTTFFAAGYSWLTAGLAAATSEEAAQLWLRIFMPFTYLMIASYYRFSMLFSRTDNRLARAYLKFSYALVACLTLVKVLNLSNGARHIEGQGWFPANDPVYAYVYVPYMLVTLAASMSMVVYRMVKAVTRTERNSQMYYFLALATAFVLDSAQLYHPISFLATFSTFAYTAMLSYAISRHRLFDLSLVVKRGALAAGLSFALAVGFIAGLLKIQELVIFRKLGFSPFALVSSGLLITGAVLMLWRPLSRRIAALLGVGGQSLEQRLLDYSTQLAKHVRFTEYLETVLRKLDGDMGLSSSAVLLKERGTGRFVSIMVDALGKHLDLAGDDPLITALESREAPIDAEEMMSADDDDVVDGMDGRSRKALARRLEELGAAVAVPIRPESGMEGVLLLGPKHSNAIFSSPELDFLQALAFQVASALENWRLHSQVQQADRLSSLGTLSASMAHELRNPLTSISTFVQMLPTRHADGVFREKFVRIVGQEIVKLTKLTEQLLSFSRPSSEARVVQDIWSMCDRVRQLLRHQFSKKSVALTLAGPQGEAWIAANEAEFSQVLINLLLNALQATPSGGQVSMEIEAGPAEVALSVSDSGSGMSQEQLKHIFEPFFTTKESGTGLGLPTCQRIVQQHQGRMSVTSSPGQGSRFTVTLKTAKPARQAASQAA